MAEVEKRNQVAYTAMYVFVIIIQGNYYHHILGQRRGDAEYEGVKHSDYTYKRKNKSSNISNHKKYLPHYSMRKARTVYKNKRLWKPQPLEILFDQMMGNTATASEKSSVVRYLPCAKSLA